MELPIKTKTFFNPIHNFIKPFIQSHPVTKQNFIMPLHEVEKVLHDYYVSMKPLTIVFEYYDHQLNIQLDTMLVRVDSVTDETRSIVLFDIQNQQPFQLSTEQILTVSANTV